MGLEDQGIPSHSRIMILLGAFWIGSTSVEVLSYIKEGKE